MTDADDFSFGPSESLDALLEHLTDAARAFDPVTLEAAAAYAVTSPEFQQALAAVKKAGLSARDWRAAVAAVRKAREPMPAPRPVSNKLQPGTASGTDLAHAEALVQACAGQLVHVRELGGWHVWDGRRWALDQAAAERFAKDVARQLMIKAVERDEHRALEDAKRAQSARGLQNMLLLASTEAAVSRKAQDFDRDPMLLNCINGTIDLRTGQLRPHDKADHITHLCPVAYDPAAKSAIWDAFLEFATEGNAEFASFLQRAVGYSLTGRTDEEKLFLIHGKENTGKSTFIGAVKATLGSLSKTADMATFIEQRFSNRGGPSEDIARLAGARIVASIEVEEGSRLAHSLVKHVTGKEMITARFLHRDSFEFMPAFKLWLVCNDAPRVDHDDGAMWRRVLRIPLDRIVPPERRDPRVKAHLIGHNGAPGPGAPAVLAWAVQGCLDWQAKGLAAPEIIKKATDHLREENDPLREFIAAKCVINPADREWHWVLKSEIRRSYEEWCKSVGARFPIGPKPFAKNLRERQCTEGSKRTKDGVQDAWFGIRLRTSLDGPPVHDGQYTDKTRVN